MRIHFVCRGNTFRSRMAESYFTSLGLRTPVVSSGTIADRTLKQSAINVSNTDKVLKKHNLPLPETSCNKLTKGRCEPGDYFICMNRIVFDEAKEVIELNGNYEVWDVTDINETGENKPRTDKGIDYFDEESFKQIKKRIDTLVKTRHIS